MLIDETRGPIAEPFIQTTSAATGISLGDSTSATTWFDVVLPAGVPSPATPEATRASRLMNIRRGSFARLAEAWRQLANL